MFDASWFCEYDEEWCYVYDITIEKAIEMAEGDYEDLSIETSCLGTTVFEDGEWIYSVEEAVKIAKKEIEAETEKEAEKADATAKAVAEEKASWDDAEDKSNIKFILSVAYKYPAKDRGADRAAEEISKTPGWKRSYGYKTTEETLKKGNRSYLLSMWKGVRKVERIKLTNWYG